MGAKAEEKLEISLDELTTYLHANHSVYMDVDGASYYLTDVNNHEYTYAVGTIYMDLINECEKLGDYVVNVVEARMGIR